MLDTAFGQAAAPKKIPPVFSEGTSKRTSARLGDTRRTLADTCLGRLTCISDAEREVLSKVPVNVRVFGAREELIKQGSHPSHLYFQKEGWTHRYVANCRGDRQIVTLLLPGGVCNLDNLLFERADFGVRTLTEAVVLCVPRQQALELLAEHPGIGRAFTSLALADNAILTQWAVCLGRRSAEARLAHLLLEICFRMRTAEAAEEGFHMPLTQEVLADVLGLTIVHTNRILQRLRGLGLVATKGRKMLILDPLGLRQMAEFDPSYLHQIDDCYADTA
jgi:CRP-like cAMP-binding protein